VLRDIFIELLNNPPLVAAGLACLVAQVTKIFYYLGKEKKWDWKHLFEAGGMPSAHSATVTSLTLTIGLTTSFSSPWFAVALIFAIIVMYDATGVRRAAGMQALILNRIVEDIYNTGKVNQEKLKELIGHTPLEVVMGVLVGFLTATIFYLYFI